MWSISFRQLLKTDLCRKLNSCLRSVFLRLGPLFVCLLKKQALVCEVKTLSRVISRIYLCTEITAVVLLTEFSIENEIAKRTMKNHFREKGL